MLAADIKSAPKINRFGQETFHQAALISSSDRDPVDVILRRSRVLLNDINNSPSAPNLAEYARQLQSLDKLASTTDVKNMEKRFALFKRAYALRRNIAFSNWS